MTKFYQSPVSIFLQNNPKFDTEKSLTTKSLINTLEKLPAAALKNAAAYVDPLCKAKGHELPENINHASGCCLRPINCSYPAMDTWLSLSYVESDRTSTVNDLLNVLKSFNPKYRIVVFGELNSIARSVLFCTQIEGVVLLHGTSLANLMLDINNMPDQDTLADFMKQIQGY